MADKLLPGARKAAKRILEGFGVPTANGSVMAEDIHAELEAAGYGDLLRAAEHAAQSQNHSPCWSGGIVDGEVGPNACICEWADKIRRALQKLEHSDD